MPHAKALGNDFHGKGNPSLLSNQTIDHSLPIKNEELSFCTHAKIHRLEWTFWFSVFKCGLGVNFLIVRNEENFSHGNILVLQYLECPWFSCAPIAKQIFSLERRFFRTEVNASATYARSMIMPILKNGCYGFESFVGVRISRKWVTPLPKVPSVISPFLNEINLLP